LLFVNVECFFGSGLREFDACNQASMMRINSPILSVGVFSFLEGYEGVFDPSKQAKHDNLTTNHNDFCMLFLLQLSAQVEAWSVLLLEARMIYYYYILLLSIAVEAGMFFFFFSSSLLICLF
jgi:hypothetical protein